MVGIKINIKVSIDDAKLQSIIRKFPKIKDNIVLAGARKGAELVKRGIEMQRSEWPELSPATIARKGHNVIMIDSTDFYRSIDYKLSGSGQAVYFTDVEYMPLHEFGLLEGVPRRASFTPTVEGSELQEIVDAIVKSAMMELN